jgi:hypothetical protein
MGSSFERVLSDLISRPLFFTKQAVEKEEIDSLPLIEYALNRQVITKKRLYQTEIPLALRLRGGRRRD